MSASVSEDAKKEGFRAGSGQAQKLKEIWSGRSNENYR